MTRSMPLEAFAAIAVVLWLASVTVIVVVFFGALS